MKKIILLGLILLLGFILRSYNLNFPSIGYHNMKENEYLSMAQEMQRTGDYIARRVYFYNAFEDKPTMKLYPQPPLVSYQVLASWKVLGKNLWGPRLINVFFGIAAILVMYFIVLLLFKNPAHALFCAFLLAIMPLAVFFSRNLQPESPAFFFMILGSLFYLRFISSLKICNLLLGGIAFSIAWLYKFSFLSGILPFVICMPYKEILRHKRGAFLKYALAFMLPYLIIAASILWLKYTGQWEFEELHRVKPWEIFFPAYWKKYGRIIWWYVKGENFTLGFTLLTAGGIALAFLKRRGLLNRYIIGSALTAIPYCMLLSDYINQHNYYQMPFLALVCISAVYAASFLAELVKKIIGKSLFIPIMVIVIAVSLPLVRGSISRMYGSVFPGEDVAGESLREFTRPDERIFLFTYPQGYAIARYARRYMGWVSGLDDFKNKERKFNVRYACFYPAEFARQLNDPALFEYLRNNYHYKEVGITGEANKPNYIILERGRATQEEQKNFLQSFSGKKQLRTIYKLSGKYIFFYSLRTAE